MNIIFKKPDGSIAVTMLAVPVAKFNKLTDNQKKIVLVGEATRLKKNGDVPKDWEQVASNISLPEDRLFRGAWSWETSKPVIDINVNRAKELVHEKRRLKREEEIAPLDKQININIGNQTALNAIESDRVKIREKHEKIQTDINACKDESELRSLIESESL